MAIDSQQKYREMAIRGKYQRLYTHLSALDAEEWRASFGEVEAIIGFELPPSARLYRPWWANQSTGNGHSQALAWTMAGWETADVEMDAERLRFKRKQRPESLRKINLDELWPVHPTARWAEGVSMRREDIYGDRT